MTSFLSACARRGDDAFCVLHRLGDRLFHEDVRARLEGADGVVGMRVGPGVDRDDVGLQRLERLPVIGKARHVRPAFRQVGALGDAPGAEPRELEPVDLVVGAGVRGAHIADSDHQHAQCAVLLRYSVRLSVRLRGHVFPPLAAFDAVARDNRSYTRETPVPPAEHMAARRARRRCARSTASLDPVVVRVLGVDFKAVAITVWGNQWT